MLEDSVLVKDWRKVHKDSHYNHGIYMMYQKRAMEITGHIPWSTPKK